jgi:hypothetical protein
MFLGNPPLGKVEPNVLLHFFLKVEKVEKVEMFCSTFFKSGFF